MIGSFGLQGPFTAAELRGWHREGALKGSMHVRHVSWLLSATAGGMSARPLLTLSGVLDALDRRATVAGGSTQSRLHSLRKPSRANTIRKTCTRTQIAYITEVLHPIHRPYSLKALLVHAVPSANFNCKCEFPSWSKLQYKCCVKCLQHAMYEHAVCKTAVSASQLGTSR